MKLRAASVITLIVLLFACGNDAGGSAGSVSSGEEVTTEDVGVRGSEGFGSGGFLNTLLEAAAEKLEISVEALTDAVGQPPNLEVAAEKLKISIESLTDALPDFGSLGGGQRGGFAGATEFLGEAADKLGVAVEELIEALGRPLDLNAAAEKLGLDVKAIEEALPGQIRRGGGRTRGAE